jgi:hypothetical protein
MVLNMQNNKHPLGSSVKGCGSKLVIPTQKIAILQHLETESCTVFLVLVASSGTF